MYIKTIKLEKAGLKAFREDPLTDDEDCEQEEGSYFNGSWNPLIYFFKNQNSLSDRSIDEEAGYEGGRSNRNDDNIS